MDVLITNGIYAAFYDVYGNLSSLSELTFDPMALFFSESFQIGVVFVFVLVLLQVLGLVDLAHGERNLSFHYDQLHQGKNNRLGWNGTWHTKGTLGSGMVGLLLYVADDHENYVALYYMSYMVQAYSYTR